MVDSKENYKFDLEVKGLIYFFLSQNRRIETLSDVMMVEVGWWREGQGTRTRRVSGGMLARRVV